MRFTAALASLIAATLTTVLSLPARDRRPASDQQAPEPSLSRKATASSEFQPSPSSASLDSDVSSVTSTQTTSRKGRMQAEAKIDKGKAKTGSEGPAARGPGTVKSPSSRPHLVRTRDAVIAKLTGRLAESGLHQDSTANDIQQTFDRVMSEHQHSSTARETFQKHIADVGIKPEVYSDYLDKSISIRRRRYHLATLQKKAVAKQAKDDMAASSSISAVKTNRQIRSNQLHKERRDQRLDRFHGKHTSKGIDFHLKPEQFFEKSKPIVEHYGATSYALLLSHSMKKRNVSDAWQKGYRSYRERIRWLKRAGKLADGTGTTSNKEPPAPSTQPGRGSTESLPKKEEAVKESGSTSTVVVTTRNEEPAQSTRPNREKGNTVEESKATPTEVAAESGDMAGKRTSHIHWQGTPIPTKPRGKRSRGNKKGSWGAEAVRRLSTLEAQLGHHHSHPVSPPLKLSSPHQFSRKRFRGVQTSEVGQSSRETSSEFSPSGPSTKRSSNTEVGSRLEGTSMSASASSSEQNRSSSGAEIEGEQMGVSATRRHGQRPTVAAKSFRPAVIKAKQGRVADSRVPKGYRPPHPP